MKRNSVTEPAPRPSLPTTVGGCASLLPKRARRGRTAPNPPWLRHRFSRRAASGLGHTVGGRPHAETEALAMAGGAAQGATAYVTLEPCSHTGQTGPCSDALAAAGIARVVIAMRDPDPRVNGHGIEARREKALRCRSASRPSGTQGHGRVSDATSKASACHLKTATSLDGMIALRTGRSGGSPGR